MKKLSILFIIFALAFVSCGEETISEKERREAKLKAKQERVLIDVPITAETELIDVPVIVEESIEKVVHVTYTTVSTDSSYWFVRMEDEKIMWHGVVNLSTPYFDFYEARKQFTKAKGKCFFETVVQISKESVPTYYKHSKLNKK